MEVFPLIYLDNATGSFPKPTTVVDTALRSLREYSVPFQSRHVLSMNAGTGVESTRVLVSEFFGTPHLERAAFTKNATEALNIAIASLKGHIITTECEHNSILRPIYHRRRYTVVETDDLGRYTVGDIEKAIREDTCAVVISHACGATGNLAPVTEVGELCRSRGLLFVLDASLTAGLFPVHMEKLWVDALCYAGHKYLFALQGTGGLILSPRYTPEPLITGETGYRQYDKEQPRMLPDQYEVGAVNAQSISTLTAGIRYINTLGMDRILAHSAQLARQLSEGVKEIGGITLYGDYEAPDRLPIVTLNIGMMESAKAATALANTYGIAVGSGAQSCPLMHSRMGTARRGALRFSFSHMNTKDEVQAALDALREIRKSQLTLLA